MPDDIFNFDLSEVIRLELITQYLGPGFKFVGMGKDRITFLSPNKRFVLKFPKWDNGFLCNTIEADTWKQYHKDPSSDGICYAPCRLLKNGVLMMWSVTELQGGTSGCDIGRAHLGGEDAYDYECDDGTPKRDLDLPEWVASTDCCQVGYLRNGKLAVYDYGE